MSKHSRCSSVQIQSPNELLNESIDEIHFTLEQLAKVTIRREKSANRRIEESLLRKHQEAKSKLAEKRMKKKSVDLKELTLRPVISKSSNKMIINKHNSEIQLVLNSMKKIEPEEEEKAIRPQDIIPAPDLESIRKLFTSRTTKKELKSDKINPFRLNLVEKTKYFHSKKQKMIKEIETKKKIEAVKECTFKPDLSKTLINRRRSSEMLGEVLVTEGKGEEESRPAPKPRAQRCVSMDFDKESIGTYVEISPDKRNYGYKEGMNLNKFIQKSKPMLRYDMATD